MHACMLPSHECHNLACLVDLYMSVHVCMHAHTYSAQAFGADQDLVDLYTFLSKEGISVGRNL